MKAEHFDIGDEVFVIDDMFEPVVQRATVVSNPTEYPEHVYVELFDREWEGGCHPDQLLHVDADADEVDDVIDVRDRIGMEVDDE